MSDTSKFSNILIIVFFSAIALAGMLLINLNSESKSIPINQQTSATAHKVYLVDEITTDRVSRIGIYIDTAINEVKTGKVVVEFDKEKTQLDDIIMESEFTGLNQSVDPATGIATIDFKANNEVGTDGDFKLAELYFVRTSSGSFRVKLSEDSMLNASDEELVLNSLEII